VVLTWTTAVCGIPFWLYVICAYFGLSLLNLRTFAEHQAHESLGGRTVIVEASPFFGLLFLNNNLHYVHHENPRVPWYDLPALYRSKRGEFLAANESYRFKGYGEVIRRHLFHAKAPVPHPYLRRE
jgi:fatty acid desaturase